MDFIYKYLWNFIILYDYRCLASYTGFTTLLWLNSSLNLDPASVWLDSSSAYNDGTNRTRGELLHTTQGYRNTLIDSWATSSPDQIRILFLNGDGNVLFNNYFNSTERSLTDWFSNLTIYGAPGHDYHFNKTFTSYSTSFSGEDRTWGVSRYRAVVLPQYNSTTYYLVYNREGVAMLPSRVLDETARCHLSYAGSNPFDLNITVTNLFHEYCSATCRENNFPYGALHDDICSCLNTVSGPELTACNTTCAGNGSQTCGGIHFAYPADAIIFDKVETDIDVTQFNAPLENFQTHTVNGYAQISYDDYYQFIYGYNVALPSATVLPFTITMEMTFREENCSSFTRGNTTLEKTFTVNDSYTYFLKLEPTRVQCIYMHLYDNNSQLLTFPVDMTSIVLQGNRFATASVFAIEAAWWIEPEQTNTTTNSTDQCECECWVYNMLYGDSPYNNLTYTEIEDALRNVTEKLERELAVNKSELSSTIRSKTSAEDNRASATAVGYTLGAALLTFSLGGIILADIPKLWGNFQLMRENFASRICKKKDSLPDVTLTNTSNQTSRVTHC